jgi:glutamyl-tRNA synthetase
MITRLAPTPSGFLHAGNIYNFLLNWLVARWAGGKVFLRIDDLDAARMRPEYVEDIFRVLQAFGMDWDVGPAGPDDFVKKWSQTSRTDRYVELIEKLNSKGFTYACVCSRKQLAEMGLTGRYTGICREKNHELVTGKSALRMNLQALEQSFLPIGEEEKNEDPIVLRRDGIPAYHIASICDDLSWGVTKVIRGEDLRMATQLQQQICRAADLTEFANIEFEHHPLLTDNKGAKLSKSAGATSASLLNRVSSPVMEILMSFSIWRGIDLKGRRPEKAADLLDFFE